MELYSRSEAAAMLGITVRKLDELRARRLIVPYYITHIRRVTAVLNEKQKAI